MRYIIVFILFLFTIPTTTLAANTLYPESNTRAYIDKVFMSKKELKLLIDTKVTEKINQNQALFNGNVDTWIASVTYGMGGLGLFITILFAFFQFWNKSSFKNVESNLTEKIDTNTNNINETMTTVKDTIKDTIKFEMIYYISDKLDNIEEQSVNYAKNKLDKLENKSLEDAKQAIGNLIENTRETLELERKLLFSVDKYFIKKYAEGETIEYMKSITLQYSIKQIIHGDQVEASTGLDKLSTFHEIDYIVIEFIEFIDRIAQHLKKFNDSDLTKSVEEYKNRIAV